VTEPPIPLSGWLSLHVIRHGMDKSNALPDYKYYAQSNQEMSMLKTKEAEALIAPADIADGLLEEWWHWSRAYRPNLGAPRIAPYCQGSAGSRQWDDSGEITDEYVRRETMDAVQFCVDSLPSYRYEQAIGIEMRNRQANAKVWRPMDQTGCNVTYQQALNAVIPKMRQKCLI